MTPDELKAARLAVGLTQADLAAKLGVSRETLNTWEKGRARRGVPERASVAVLALLGAAPAEQKLKPICYDNCPELYTLERAGRRKWVRANALHPRNLLPASIRTALDNEWRGETWPMAVLDMPAYLEARATYRPALPANTFSFAEQIEREVLAEAIDTSRVDAAINELKEQGVTDLDAVVPLLPLNLKPYGG